MLRPSRAFRSDEGVRMSFQQLDPPIPVHVLDKGPGYAFAVIDYGQIGRAHV